jgi:hypothetical protein
VRFVCFHHLFEADAFLAPQKTESHHTSQSSPFYLTFSYLLTFIFTFERSTMTKLSPLTLLLLFVPSSAAFLAPSVLKTKGCNTITRMANLEDFLSPSRSSEISRQDALRNLMGIAGALAFAPSVARADVSDGNQLPQGAQQFARVLRLKTDLQV